MKGRIKLIRTVFLLVVLLFLIQTTGSVFSYIANDMHDYKYIYIYIIANKDVPVNSLTKSEVKSIFLGEMIMWSNAKKITFVILKTKTHDDFLREYIGNTEAQYRNYWKKMVFTGKSKSPRSFKSVEELLEYVANTSGAIGYIPASTYNDKVKIISVKEERDE